MLWGLELFFSISFGYELSLFVLKDSVDLITHISIGIPLGFSYFTILAFFLSNQKYLNKEIGLASLILKLINSKSIKMQKIRINSLELLSILIPTIFLSFFFYISYYFNNNEFKSHVMPDQVFHESVIQSFIHGVNYKRKTIYDLRNTIVSSKNLTYPFLPDYHAAVLIGTGYCTMKITHLITSFIYTFSLFSGFYYLSFSITKSHFSSIISMFIFMNISGAQFIYFNPKIPRNPKSWSESLIHYPIMYFHIALDMILSQKSSLYSFPCVFWAMYLLINSKNQNWRYMIMAGLLVGILPQTQ